ncbi:alpha/beta fold hydrolase [Phytomonospora endophytica]|uniref:Pimeloyl-ACP methyl ester carboxylesterase n=1 Tax=Phytomonospora endophytica TaxID=714109 RepID=A0A841FGU6_9ACTN|nr:alpha/beta hydrolase [Phytomonospora endophytica]MBB6033068.1 pimeloyl-ACP methyl ester carboxylesterase [Phytomonospora endophytica]GIG65295.1 hydrolase [Phytomonospora endophytica]
MNTLDVPGARLHYEVYGSGPTTLLLIPGGNGDAAPYSPLARAFAETHTVIAYDRRGYSRSPIDTPFDADTRLDADVADAVALLDTVGGAPADVFGSSSGAIVGLHLLTAHPDRIRTLVAHEPPLVTLLPDADDVLALLDRVHDLHRTKGVEEAMRVFGEGIGQPHEQGPPPDGLPAPVLEMIARMRGNFPFFLEEEVTRYPRRVPDRTALKSLADKLILAGGEDSREEFPYRPNLVLAAELGLTVHDLPGDHIGYVSARETFPRALAALLDAR